MGSCRAYGRFFDGSWVLLRRDDLTQKNASRIGEIPPTEMLPGTFLERPERLALFEENKSTMILDTPPERCPVGLHGTCSSLKPNSRIVNIEKELPVQMLTAPVKFLG